MRSYKSILSVLTIVIASALTIPSVASASTSNFCGGWLGGYGTCWAAARTVTAIEAWGEQHSVCIGYAYQVYDPGAGVVWAEGPTKCSGGPGAHVHMEGAYFGSGSYVQPRISNNAAGNNLVYGVATQP